MQHFFLIAYYDATVSIFLTVKHNLKKNLYERPLGEITKILQAIILVDLGGF